MNHRPLDDRMTETIDKEALAREARSVLGNIEFRRAIKAIEENANERLIAEEDDAKWRIHRDQVRIARGIVQMLEMAIIDNQQSMRPRSIA